MGAVYAMVLVARFMSATGVTAEFIVIEGAAHGFYDEDADRAGSETVAWFERHLVTGRWDPKTA